VELVSDGRTLVAGSAQGKLLSSEVGLSFWGGVDPLTGIVIDQHHPLRNQSLAGQVLAIPSGRGSCSGSGVLLELILNGHAPAAIVIYEREEILTLGALVAEVVFERSIPVLRVKREVFAHLGEYRYAGVAGSSLQLFHEPPVEDWQPETTRHESDKDTTVRLDVIDQAFLSGQHGKAAQIAMRLLLRMATIQGAEAFMNVSQVHIDGCVYTGPACLRFAQMLVDWGARVRVPTTLNAISVDKRRWRAQGIAEDLGAPASALADAYVAMGAQPSFTGTVNLTRR
jgi:predicted aconitase with swiveling domain